MRTAFTRAMMAGHPARVSSPRKARRASAVPGPPVGEVPGVPRRERSCPRALSEAERLQQPTGPHVRHGGAGPDLVDLELLQQPPHRSARMAPPSVVDAEEVGDLRPAVRDVHGGPYLGRI